MAKGRATTIFKQLIFNIVIPTLLALLVLAAFNFYRTRRILTTQTEEKNKLLSNEITKILRFQDVAFKLIDEEVDNRLKNFSNTLVDKYFTNTDNLEKEKLNLRGIANKMGMDSVNEDIYIIRRDGIVINTTFQQDLDTNLYSYGEKFQNFLLDIFRNRDFVTDLFAIEATTKRPKKYTYQPTHDRKYIIELGAYSKKADDIINFMEETKNEIKNESEGIIDVELFLMADEPFSMNQDVLEVPAHDTILLAAFQNRDTLVVERNKDGWYQYQYIYVERSASNLYKGSVIRIISDVTQQKALFRREALFFIVIFGITLFIVAYLIYRKTRVITLPIKNLVENVDRITNGNLRERAEVTGNNEVTRLSEKFNMMIAQLESYYYELEAKVKERTIKIEKQKEEIEEQKKHIMDSIHYARRIQNAILPSFSMISEHLSNYFVLYLPKDIVSGDFYWFHDADGLFMVAAVDCTGHGVPGAFMSIVGFNQLNHVVNVKKARSASVILDELNKGVITTLNENKTTGSIKDGMDMALCILDLKSNNAEFAGANNPMYLIRNNQLIKYKGDRFPIGAFEGSEPQLFNNNEIDLSDGDCIYLFSDGYADQFGGPENKKFMYKKFEDLLIEINRKPMEVQKEILLSRLDEWKGKNEQVDDILIIGIRI
ncbi:MAG: SpoIIE family protein phosphatase [Bacteroidales bacterium]|jgi:serine phosphatase RsbU (regulator of sigma subunit)|nr:SpoIIE family protein phosphatase [Bacteroidales bacterium]